MTDNYIKSKSQDEIEDTIPQDKYTVLQYYVVDHNEFPENTVLEYFPLFGAQDDIFKEIPDYVWQNVSARLFLQQLAMAYSVRKNPSLSYSRIRADKEDSYFVLEWVFQDKRFSFFFNEVGDNKYSILYYNAEEKTFINSVKTLSPERYKEIAEEVLSFLS